jgi:O-antigen/teichoic acid export membrane protein
MEKLRRIIGNVTISLLGQIATWTSTLLLTIAYGRFLGATKFGELFFAITFVTLVVFPFDVGFGNQIVRGVAQEPDQANRYFSNAFLLKLAIWPLTYVFVLLFSWLLGYPMEVRILLGTCGIYMLTSMIGNTFASLHYAFERTIFPTIGAILEKGLSALFGILLLRAGADVQVMPLIMIGGSFISAVWQGIWFFRQVGVKFVIDPAFMLKILRGNAPFVIYGFLQMGYAKLDTILLSFMTNSSVVGWYGAGTRLYDTLNFLPNIVVATIMYPIFSKLSVTSDEDLKLALEKSVNFLLFCGIPISTLLIVTAPNIIGFLYARSEFAHTIPALQALAPGLIFTYMNYILSSTILSKKQDKNIPIIAGIALVFNLGFNLILIPLYLHIGAAIATALTEMLICTITIIFFTPRHLLPFRSLRTALKALIASLITVAAILPLRSLNIFVILTVAVPVYLVVSVLIGTIPKEDYLMIYRTIRQKAGLTGAVVGQISQENDAQ